MKVKPFRPLRETGDGRGKQLRLARSGPREVCDRDANWRATVETRGEPDASDCKESERAETAFATPAPLGQTDAWPRPFQCAIEEVAPKVHATASKTRVGNMPFRIGVTFTSHGVST